MADTPYILAFFFSVDNQVIAKQIVKYRASLPKNVRSYIIGVSTKDGQRKTSMQVPKLLMDRISSMPAMLLMSEKAWKALGHGVMPHHSFISVYKGRYIAVLHQNNLQMHFAEAELMTAERQYHCFATNDDEWVIEEVKAWLESCLDSGSKSYINPTVNFE